MASGTIGGQAFERIPSPLNWRQDGRLYDARWALYSPHIGEHTRTSTGLLAPQGLIPITASLRTPELQTTHFDYATERVRFDRDGDNGDADMPLPAGALDRVGALIQLGALLSADPERTVAGQVIKLPAARNATVGLWRFTVEGEENLPALQTEQVPTVHLIHLPQDAQDARIDVWLGRTLDFLPVRLRINEPNGDTVEYNVQTAYTQQVPTATPPPTTTMPTTPEPSEQQ